MRETDTEITKKDKEETQTENGEVCIEETANSEDEIKENTAEAEFDSENTETEETEDEAKDFEEVIPTRKRKMSCFINTIILTYLFHKYERVLVHGNLVVLKLHRQSYKHNLINLMTEHVRHSLEYECIHHDVHA